MAITQLSAFLENTPGTLYKAVCAISDAGVNLRALSVADTSDFGILRVIVSDIDKTIEALSDDTIVTRTQVIAVRMSDKAGALKEILNVLQDAGINIEYVYAFTANAANSAYVVLRVNDIEEAEEILLRNGRQILSDSDLNTILP
ncbi:MAG: ACT domain-containing protein [Eubacteriales bacterium]|nr:ACT domain-containing protein [Eubacteriales bacterium]